MVDYDGDWRDISWNGVPLPTKILERPENGRAHLWWRVGRLSGKGKAWAKTIALGIARRIGGDLNSGIQQYTKNPDYPGWVVHSNNIIYTLESLDSCLSFEDKKPAHWGKGGKFGKGRNCGLYYWLADIARGMVFTSEAEAVVELEGIAQGYPFEYPEGREDQSIIASVVRRYFDGRLFASGGKKDWTLSGKSRATYFRHRKAVGSIILSSLTKPSPTVTRSCLHCGTDITTTTRKQAKFCSDSHRKLYNKMKTKPETPQKPAETPKPQTLPTMPPVEVIEPVALSKPVASKPLSLTQKRARDAERRRAAHAAWMERLAPEVRERLSQ
jgi:hypothetical protein